MSKLLIHRRFAHCTRLFFTSAPFAQSTTTSAARKPRGFSSRAEGCSFHHMGSPMTHTPSEPLLDVADLCRMFEESESASLASRKDAERDRDYVDGKQFKAD